jgi:hypothetical protein
MIQVPRLRITSDNIVGDDRVVTWEIYDASNTTDILASSTEQLPSSIFNYANLKSLLSNRLEVYLDQNNIVEPYMGSPTKLVKWTTGNISTSGNTTPVDLTNLSFPYQANTSYVIRIMGRVQPAAATTGIGLQFDLTSVVTQINVSFYHQLANTGTLTGGHSIADDASVAVSSGFPGTSTYPVVGTAWLRTAGNTGTAQLRIRSETNAVITAMQGFAFIVEKL